MFGAEFINHLRTGSTGNGEKSISPAHQPPKNHHPSPDLILISKLPSLNGITISSAGTGVTEVRQTEYGFVKADYEGRAIIIPPEGYISPKTRLKPSETFKEKIGVVYVTL